MKLGQKISGSILLTFFIIALIFLILGIAFQRIRDKNYLDQTEFLLTTLIDREQDKITNELFENRIRALEIRTSDLIRIKNMEYIAVYQGTGSLLVSQTAGKVKSSHRFPGFDGGLNDYLIEGVKIDGVNGLRIIKPISVIGELIGFLEVFYSLNDLMSARRVEMIFIASLILVMLVMMLLILNIIINLTILNPVKSLNNSMNTINQVGPGIQVPVSSDDELGELAFSFNRMSKDLSEEMQKGIEKQTMIQKSLDEKVVLIREIHHRVKNNLQVISSILKLQLGYSSDRSMEPVFNDIIGRINSMGLIHELLYQTDNFTRVSFREYLNSLISFIRRSYQKQEVSIVTDLDDIYLTLDTAIPAGLLANEILSNGFKHGLQGIENPEIRVEVKKEGENHFRMKISDNGHGFEMKKDLSQIKSLGLKLIHTLVMQLDGSMNFQGDSGAVYDILLKEQKT